MNGFYFGRCQVIIPGCWIFAWTLNIPLIIVTNFDKETGDCKWMWPEQWMGAANETTWLVGLAFIPLMVMTGLYSRVVHMLWFKRNDNELANRQRVRTNKNPLRNKFSAVALIVESAIKQTWLPYNIYYKRKHETFTKWISILTLQNRPKN